MTGLLALSETINKGFVESTTLTSVSASLREGNTAYRYRSRLKKGLGKYKGKTIGRHRFVLFSSILVFTDALGTFG
eukprot:1825858-Amphidinium_carterae.2